MSFAPSGGSAPVRPVDRHAQSAPQPVPRQSKAPISSYTRRILLCDTAVVVLAVLIAQLLSFGNLDVSTRAVAGIPALVISAFVAIAWLSALRVFHSVDRRIIGPGAGATEFNRVFVASFCTFGGFAILDTGIRLDMARGYYAIVFAFGTATLLFTRWLLRAHIGRARTRGNYVNQILVLGDIETAELLIERIAQQSELGFEVVGVCLPPSESSRRSIEVCGGVPVFGDFHQARHAVALSGATAVAITCAESLGFSEMRELSWQMEEMDVEMIVLPGLADVAASRVMVRPAAGLPFLYIEKPRYEGANRFLKAAFDRIVAVIAIIAVAPVLLACAVAIKLDSRGPLFYRAERMGLNNEPFLMWKFRSMVVEADRLVHTLTDRSDGNGVLFKMREDPRVTRLGKFLRRYSLDELPQLFNVVGGSMSLVGPRPPLRGEVESYSGPIVRRMLVRPGITGLWQVSGRSDLTWEESVRLDLSYIENWSMTTDLLILWRTARAVLGGSGAY